MNNILRLTISYKDAAELLEFVNHVKGVDKCPPDMIDLWNFMQDKNIGVRVCIGRIYALGYMAAVTDRESR